MNTLEIIWVVCACLNIFSIGYNCRVQKDYSMFLPALILGIVLAPVMTLLGLAASAADL